MDQQVAQPQMSRAQLILQSNPRLQLYQKIIIGWLVAYLALRLVSALAILIAGGGGVAITAILLAFSAFFLAPAIIVLLGLRKQKVWAYWLYIVGLFGSLFSFGQAETTLQLVLGVILSLGSLVVFILTIILYRRLFPSKRRTQPPVQPLPPQS